MPNLVTLDGVIQSIWSYNHRLFARLVHYGPGDERGYFNLSFPDPVTIKETDAQGRAVRRVVSFSRQQADRLVPSAVVVIAGRLVHRDERVGLLDFVRRCPEGDAISPEELSRLEALAARLGQENRGVVDIAVQEIVFL